MSTMKAERRVALTRVYHFSAGHCLAQAQLTPEANAALYGACSRPHGHNYYVEVTISGVPDPVTGMAADLAAIDADVARAVIDRVDHRRLEDVPELAGVVTTGEGLARAFWRLLGPTVGGAPLTRVGVVETAKNRFEYRGEDG